MDKEKIIEVISDVKNKSNKDLFLAINELNDEFEKTKKLKNKKWQRKLQQLLQHQLLG